MSILHNFNKIFKSGIFPYKSICYRAYAHKAVFKDNLNNDKETSIKIKQTKFNDDSIQFQTIDNRSKIFPYIWLRDHCKCSKCFNKNTEELEFDLSEIPIDIKPISIKKTNDHSFQITCN